MPVQERFTFLDSINAIVWEFDLPSELKDFSFKPILHKNTEVKNNFLSSSEPCLFFSPPELSSGDFDQNTKWMGFLFLPIGKTRVVVLCALESSQNRLKNTLEILSKNFEVRIDKRVNRISSIIKANITLTNIPEITEAVSWAQLSLDALITQQRGKGIWAGLPGFNWYWGRDSFISFAGAFLVNGKFDEAREILYSFSRFQLQDENDFWDGRIPNWTSDKEIIYNSADITWWFIREVYEYYLYSGDSSFVKNIFPVIKRAIKGAIRHRIDENFFLLHGDTETWMDTRGTNGAWSPRGNRAIEIQSLWYTALQIGSLFAGLNNEDQLKEHWLAISHSLRENINNKFWSRINDRLYDHLNENGFPDRKVRPNQIFAVYIPRIPDIEPLFSDDRSARISSNVVHKLTYRYGIATLWQEDEDFHPWYYNPTYYPHDAAYHNGMVWSGLAGPVISTMLMFNRQELAFNLFYDQAIQILQDDAIGNFAQMRDALPRNGQSEPAISGAISHAWGLAEFTRNFYQDFIGYQPNVAKKKIKFSPKFPGELVYISTNFHFAESIISFIYKIEEEFYIFEFSLSDETNSVEIIFEYPGFDPVNFHLNGDNPSFVVSLNSRDQRSYHRYTDLEWYFVQPELVENLKAFQSKD
jgi:glycogen debranching enzyme